MDTKNPDATGFENCFVYIGHFRVAQKGRFRYVNVEDQLFGRQHGGSLAFKFDSNGECSSGGGNVEPTDLISILGSVGRLGQNIFSDVVTVQNALNTVPQSLGGPLPGLSVDGLSGPKTIGAIEKFQRVQFPGIFPDGLISPQKRTISLLNSLASGGQANGGASTSFGITGADETTQDQLDLARRLALDAERRIVDAIQRLIRTTAALTSPRRSAAAEQLVREANFHFKVNADPNPLLHLSKISAIFTFMLTAVRDSNNGTREIFRGGTDPQAEAIAVTDVGGFFSSEQSKRFIIITPIFRTGSSGVIVHELAHFCGGEEKSGREIVHRASPRPPPNGTQKEDGSTDYANMTPSLALTNAFSYQVFCFPEIPEFKVP